MVCKLLRKPYTQMNMGMAHRTRESIRDCCRKATAPRAVHVNVTFCLPVPALCVVYECSRLGLLCGMVSAFCLEISLLLLLAMLGMEPRTSHLLGKCSVLRWTPALRVNIDCHISTTLILIFSVLQHWTSPSTFNSGIQHIGNICFSWKPMWRTTERFEVLPVFRNSVDLAIRAKKVKSRWRLRLMPSSHKHVACPSHPFTQVEQNFPFEFQINSNDYKDPSFTGGKTGAGEELLWFGDHTLRKGK